MSMTELLNGIATDLALAMLANAKRLCQKQNTGQCAAICLSHMSTQTKPGHCPEIANVWLDEDCRAALERARTWVLTPSDSKAFVETLLTPPEPNTALKDAALRRHQTKMDDPYDAYFCWDKNGALGLCSLAAPGIYEFQIANSILTNIMASSIDRVATLDEVNAAGFEGVGCKNTNDKPHKRRKSSQLRQHAYTERDEFLQNHIREEIKHIWREHDQFYAMTNDGQVYIREEKYGEHGTGLVCYWIAESQVILP